MKINKIHVSALALALIVSGIATQAHAEDTTVGVQGNVSVDANANANGGGFFRNLFHMGGERGNPNANGDSNQNNGVAGMMRQGVFGTVTAVSGNTITILSKLPNATTATVYTVDATNAKIDKNRAAITVSGITVGDTVVVEGTTTGTSVVAVAIHDGAVPRGLGMMRGERGGMMDNGVFGTVTAVSGNTITISSKLPNATTATVYTVDATNATVQKNGTASTVGAIAVGDQIRAEGTVSGTIVTALRINDGVKTMPQAPQGNGQPIVGGTVTAISGNTITITNKSNVTYTLNASAATITKNGAASTIASVAVGDNVLAQGTVNGTTVTAVYITDRAQVQANVQTEGRGFFGSIGNFFAHIFGF